MPAPAVQKHVLGPKIIRIKKSGGAYASYAGIYEDFINHSTGTRAIPYCTALAALYGIEEQP